MYLNGGMSALLIEKQQEEKKSLRVNQFDGELRKKNRNGKISVKINIIVCYVNLII